MAKKIIDLNKKAEELIKMAESSGVEQNFFFMTTFKRYQTQLNTLGKLEAEIRESGTIITKEYVKNRANVYIHPAVSEYNRTSTAANQTVQTLLKIITTLEEHTLGDVGATAEM